MARFFVFEIIESVTKLINGKGIVMAIYSNEKQKVEEFV